MTRTSVAATRASLETALFGGLGAGALVAMHVIAGTAAYAVTPTVALGRAT